VHSMGAEFICALRQAQGTLRRIITRAWPEQLEVA
jgi:hypothetical protein